MENPSRAGHPPARPCRSPRGAGAGLSPCGVLTSFCCWGSFPAALVRRIDGSILAGDGFASFPALRCPPYLCPEICERVCAYVCVRLELSGIFHAGHAFPCLQPFPTSRQAGRPARIRALLPARRSLLSAAGLPCAPAFSAVFVFPNLRSFVYVCAHAHCVFALSLSFFFLPPHSLLCQMAKICFSIGSEAPAKTEGKNV